MLYDPKWDSPSRDGFIRFCESKPPEEKYNYHDGFVCAVGQYYQSCGRHTEWMRRIDNPVGWELMDKLDGIANRCASRTFGELATMLRSQ
jgi:hypothetical protein